MAEAPKTKATIGDLFTIAQLKEQVRLFLTAIRNKDWLVAWRAFNKASVMLESLYTSLVAPTMQTTSMTIMANEAQDDTELKELYGDLVGVQAELWNARNSPAGEEMARAAVNASPQELDPATWAVLAKVLVDFVKWIIERRRPIPTPAPEG